MPRDGSVERYEPPELLVVTWQITEDGKPEPNADRASEVEIRFKPIAEGSTSVERSIVPSGGPAFARATSGDAAWSQL